MDDVHFLKILEEGDLDQISQIMEGIERKGYFLSTFVTKGRDLNYAGHTERSRNLLQNLLHVARETESKRIISLCLSFLSMVQLNQGHFKEAYDNLQESVCINEELGDDNCKEVAFNVLGVYYIQTGDLKLGLKYEKIALKSAIKHKRILAIGWLSECIGDVYNLENNIEKAFKYYNLALNHFKEIKFQYGIAVSFLDLILLSLKFSRNDQAESYSDSLNKLSEVTPSIKLIKKLAKGLLLKSKPRVIYQAEAQKIFKEITNDPVVIFSLSVTSMLNLCELLINEWIVFGNQEVQSELEDLLQSILVLAKDKNSYRLISEAYILQSRFILLSGQPVKAQNILEQAKAIAEEKNLVSLVENISMEQSILSSKIIEWERLSIRSQPLSKQIKKSGIQDYVKKALAVASTENR